MLVIRFQRTGRKGHAQFRVVVQDSRRTPTSGKIVAQVGTYNPHTKEAVLDTERAQHYLSHGAQPSDRVALLFKKQGIKLPDWVKLPVKAEGKIRHADKLRRNRPEEPKESETDDAPVDAPEVSSGDVTEVLEESAAVDKPAE